MADDFCKFFDTMTAKYTLKPTGKRKYHRNSTTTKVEVMQPKATSARALQRLSADGIQLITKLKSNMK